MRATLSSLIFFLNIFLFPGVKGREPIQHRISRRIPSSILDTCAYIDAPLSDIITSISGTNSSTANETTLVEQCVCTSMVRSVLDSSDLDDLNVDMNGLVHAFEAYIAENYNAKHCVYPPHSVARCSRDDPCGFGCSGGFERASFSVRGRQADACTCPPPNTVCDGQCGSFPEGCPSMTTAREDTPASYRNAVVRPRPSPFLHSSPRPSAAFNSYAPTPTGSFSNARVQDAQDAGCAPHETRCGAYAPRGRRTMECVDTQRSLESCGGCMLPPPSPFYALDAEYTKREESVGVDCSALEGVSDVGCRTGRCVVEACQIGWVIAPSGEHCVPNAFGNAAHPNAGDGAFDSAHFVPSRMPLLKPSATTTTTSSDLPMATPADSPQDPNSNAADSGSSSDRPTDSNGSDASDTSSSPSSTRFSNARTGADPASDRDAGTGADGTATDLSLGGSTGLLSFGRFSASVVGDDDMPEDVIGTTTGDSRSGHGFSALLGLADDPSDVDDGLVGQPLYRFGNLLRPFTEEPADEDGDGGDTPVPAVPGEMNPALTIDLDLAEAFGEDTNVDSGDTVFPNLGGGPQVGSTPVDLAAGGLGDGTNIGSDPTVSSTGARLDLGRFFGAAPDPDAENDPEKTPPDTDNYPTGLSVVAAIDASGSNGDTAVVDPIDALAQDNATPPQIPGPNVPNGAGNPDLGIGILGSVSGPGTDMNSSYLDTATDAVDTANSGLGGMETGAETGAEGLNATLDPSTVSPASSLMNTASDGSGIAADAEIA